MVEQTCNSVRDMIQSMSALTTSTSCKKPHGAKCVKVCFPMLTNLPVCSNHEIEQQADGSFTIFASYQARLKVLALPPVDTFFHRRLSITRSMHAPTRN